MTHDGIPLSEFAERRRRVLEALDGAAAVLFAGSGDPGELELFRAAADFEYLTGVADEPGAALLLDPTNPAARRRASLLLAPRDPERERWDGYRPGLGAALRKRTGFETVLRTDALPRMLNAAAVRSRRLACLHAPALYDRPVSPDLRIFRRVAERVPGLTIEFRGDLLSGMRAVKSDREQALIQRAADATAAGFEAAFRTVRPGASEFEVQAAIESAYRAGGARRPAFGTIVGAGLNATVLHYRRNDGTIREGDLVCIDSGALLGAYGADVTRTLPASGRFTNRQREVYGIVLEAQAAAMNALRPGVTLPEIDDAARRVIDDAGYGDFFIHGVGHHLGLETHDASPEAPLEAGAVVTIEPGIYIPDETIGVRIEDDLAVTADGSRNLTGRIPKTADDVEAAMRRE